MKNLLAKLGGALAISTALTSAPEKAEAQYIYYPAPYSTPSARIHTRIGPFGGVRSHIDIYQPLAPVFVNPSPIFVHPAPLFIQPAPRILIQPSPIFVQPAPLFIQPAPIYIQTQPIYVNPTPILIHPAPRTHICW